MSSDQVQPDGGPMGETAQLLGVVKIVQFGDVRFFDEAVAGLVREQRRVLLDQQTTIYQRGASLDDLGWHSVVAKVVD